MFREILDCHLHTQESNTHPEHHFLQPSFQAPLHITCGNLVFLSLIIKLFQSCQDTEVAGSLFQGRILLRIKGSTCIQGPVFSSFKAALLKGRQTSQYQQSSGGWGEGVRKLTTMKGRHSTPGGQRL